MGMKTLMSSGQRPAGLRDPFEGETLTQWLYTEGLRLETTHIVEEERDPESMGWTDDTSQTGNTNKREAGPRG